MKSFICSLAFWMSVLILGACATTAPTAAPSSAASAAVGGAVAPSAGALAPSSVPRAALSPSDVITVTGDFLAPESVLHDAQADLYLVSNINGSPFAEDDNGFLSQIAPDGRVLAAHWIDGADPAITLQAPKGMAIIGDSLYVADLTVVRRFDRRTGQAQGEIVVPGATFLNDLVAAPDGTLYVSDPGLQATAAGFAENGNDAIYRIAPDGTVSTWAKSTALGHPNGLALLPDGTLIANTLNASREYYTVALNAAPSAVQMVPGGQLDGLTRLDDGSMLLSSWETNTIYRVVAAGQATPIYTNAASPSADIGYDATRQRVLIPLFSSNQIVLLPL